MQNLRKLIESLRNYVVSNYGGKYRFMFEFEDEMETFTAKHDIFPVVFVSPDTSYNISNSNGFFGQEIGLKIKVVDRINNDRTNIFTIMDETNNIINDIITFFKNSNISLTEDFQILEPLDNRTTDNLAGYEVSLAFIVTAKSECYYPSETCLDGEVILKNSIDDILNTYLVPSGNQIQVSLQDTTLDFYLNGVLQDSVSIPYGTNPNITFT